MATNVFVANAATVAQVDVFSVLSDDSTSTYAATLNGKSVSVLGTGTGATDTATAWAAALAASTFPEFVESTWTSDSTTVTRTAATPGMRCPLASETAGAFTISLSGGSGSISTVTTSVPNSGPSDWKVATNWSTGSIPGADDVYLNNTAVPLLYGLDQTGVSLVSLVPDSTFTGQLGLPTFNPAGYHEYRPTYLKVTACPTLKVGGGTGGGTGRFKVHTGGAPAVTVYSAGSPIDQGLPAVILRGTCTMTLTVEQGQVGVDIEPGDASALTAIKLGYTSNQQTDANIVLGSGATLSSCTVTQNGGVLQYEKTVAQHTMNAGTATVLNSAAIPVLSLQNGTLYYQSDSTITSTTVGFNGTLDCSQDPRARTVVNATVYGTLNDPNQSVTFTNPVSCPNGVGGTGGATLNLGTPLRVTRS